MSLCLYFSFNEGTLFPPLPLKNITFSQYQACSLPTCLLSPPQQTFEVAAITMLMCTVLLVHKWLQCTNC